ncbi:MAG: ATP-binding protein [Planctomycetota bacterium]
MSTVSTASSAIAMLKALDEAGALGPSLLIDTGRVDELRVLFSTPAMSKRLKLPPMDIESGYIVIVPGPANGALINSIENWKSSGRWPAHSGFRISRVPDSSNLLIVSAETTGVPAAESARSTLTEANGQNSFKQILDRLPFEMVCLGPDLVINYANAGFAKLLSTSRGRLAGNRLADLVEARGWQGIRPLLQRAQDGVKFVAEFEFPDAAQAGNRVGLFHFIPEFLHAPEEQARPEENIVTGINILIIDVTGFKQVQEELHLTKTKFELAVRDSMIGIWEGDINDSDWIDSRDIEKMLGLEPGELENSRQVVRTRIHPDDAALNDAERKSHLSGYNHGKAEIRMRTASGDYRWFYVAGRSESSEDGTVVRLAGTLTDIDRLKKAEIAAAGELKRRDQFLAMLSHELRNPVTAISYSAGLLKESSELLAPESPGIDEVVEAASIISRQTIQMSRLLDDLLNVARITQNRIEFDFQVNDLNMDVKSVAQGMRQVFEQKSQTLKTNWHDGTLPVFVDSMRLKQVLANLLDNASKYTQDGGVIEVSTELRDNRAVFTVEDNGHGISPDIIENIFELFFQKSQTIGRESGGLGVGLFIVRNIVDSHRGTVEAFSKGEGLGSRFEVSIPLFSSPDGFKNAGSESIRFSGQKLMLVEDNSDARRVLSRILELRGFEVHQFSDGESALAAVERICPEVALIDIGLPGKNGYELAKGIRMIDQCNGMLLIALTGYGQEDDRNAAFQAGFDKHLTKPTRPAELCEYIAARISR